MLTNLSVTVTAGKLMLYFFRQICFIKALEAVGLAPNGKGGEWVRSAYNQPGGPAPTHVNTHGGLLGFGAPWEVPAFYNIVSVAKSPSS
eukprot:SAG31_NODE_199_length_20573_cov_5.832129_9_plen_89_part_00